MLPPALPKSDKRASRWKSPAHRSFVTSRACCRCGSTTALECAHVRIGSEAGMGQKPDDFRCVGLCKFCHQEQHQKGERTFWKGCDVEALIAAYNHASPKRYDIEHAMGLRNL